LVSFLPRPSASNIIPAELDPGEEKRKEGGKRKKEKKGGRREKEKKKERGRGGEKRNYD